MTQEREPNLFIALLSALLFPGLGLLYLGLPIFAFGAGLLPIIMLIVFSVTIQNSLFGFWLSISSLIIWQLFLIIFTIARFKKHEKYTYKWFNSGLFVILLGVTLVLSMDYLIRPIYLRTARYRPFSSPTASMKPSMQIGDRFIVDTSWYKKHPIETGDIIVYDSPEDYHIQFAKRVVALGGDTIELKDGKLFINGKMEILNRYQIIQSSLIPIKMDDYHQYTMPLVSIPQNYVFCVGDNRGNSSDSRHYGPISLDNIRGKVIYIWWPLRNARKMD